VDAVIEARGVTKRWGAVTALDDVTVSVPDGVTGLLGANGAGKTTLLGLVLGFHRPDAGELRVLGQDPATAGPQVRARVGYAPEHDALPPEARAQELVRHVAELHGIPRGMAVVRASEALDLVGLGEERLRPIGTMSTGQRQRVKIAQAIAHDPRLLLLDEPTNGLDPMQRDDMLALIRRIGTELGIHVVVSSHLLAEVERVCDGVVVLEDGRLAGSGGIRDLATDPQGPHVVEIDGPSQRLQELVVAAGFVARILGPYAVAVELGSDDFDRFRDVIADAELPLRRFEPIRTSLEERFFETGGQP
jgi:ABC-2 type transport system ATP-binding protein